MAILLNLDLCIYGITVLAECMIFFFYVCFLFPDWICNAKATVVPATSETEALYPSWRRLMRHCVWRRLIHARPSHHTTPHRVISLVPCMLTSSSYLDCRVICSLLPTLYPHTHTHTHTHWTSPGTQPTKITFKQFNLIILKAPPPRTKTFVFRHIETYQPPQKKRQTTKKTLVIYTNYRKR